jgi:hypothetical protein
METGSISASMPWTFSDFQEIFPDLPEIPCFRRIRLQSSAQNV